MKQVRKGWWSRVLARQEKGKRRALLMRVRIKGWDMDERSSEGSIIEFKRTGTCNPCIQPGQRTYRYFLPSWVKLVSFMTICLKRCLRSFRKNKNLIRATHSIHCNMIDRPEKKLIWQFNLASLRASKAASIASYRNLSITFSPNRNKISFSIENPQA